MPSASASSNARGIDAARSSGIFWRCALYAGYASCLKVGEPGSIANTTCVGRPFFSIEYSPFASPISADVFIPDAVILGFFRNTKWPL